ncbi:MAG: hypothetical protein ISS57_13980 [Anaerolineales bacterium]|nr:hypothetical protein [Anaerolineales bacterium]
MNRGWFLSIGLTICLGLGACTLTASPAQVSVGSSTPGMTASPTATNNISPSATATPRQEISATPAPTLAPTPLTCWDEGGLIENQQLKTDLFPDPLVFRVYLPPCYDQEPEREYPLLYLLHGQTYTEDQWIRLGVDDTADTLIAAKQIPPLIIVMPLEQDDHTPPPENPYGEALVSDLIPYIDKTFRTRAERAYRAIGGLSRGGNWAVHLGLSHWEKFGALGGHSTPSFVTDGPPRIREYLKVIPDDQIPRIYMDAGEDDGWIFYTFKLEAVFTEENIPHEWYLFQGAHDEEYWAAHIEDYLRWYTLDW